MEKNMKTNDREYMKMAILKHEETFKEQVYELHRLYQIQKQLMKNIEYNQNRVNLNHQKIHQNLDHPDNLDEDESEIKLTLGPSSFNRRMRRKTETPLNSDSGASFSSSSSGSNYYTKRTERGREGQNWENRGNLDISGRRKFSSAEEEDEEEMRQNRVQQSPWLITALSLNIS